jgi:tripartite-type tricarboxylate transporter receptor subunit TctC
MGSHRLAPHRRSLLALPLLAVPLLARAARAEESWPSRPVRLVIPFGPGGPIDTVGRMLAEHLRDRLGQPFIIDNRPGAGGSIGIRAVVQSPPDGTAFVLTSSSLASVPALYPNQGLDPRSAMTPVSLVAEVPTAMVVRADGPYRSVADVVAAAKARPNTLTYGSGGVGSSNHLSGALFASAAGVALEHISYRGAAAARSTWSSPARWRPCRMSAPAAPGCSAWRPSSGCPRCPTRRRSTSWCRAMSR